VAGHGVYLLGGGAVGFRAAVRWRADGVLWVESAARRLAARGWQGSAREIDIAVSQNLLLDIDLNGAVVPSRLASLTRFLRVADEYFTSLGIGRPFRASTGRGSHLLFAYEPLTVAACPDIRGRLRSFKEGFASAVRSEALG
jgi:hypothetical protein